MNEAGAVYITRTAHYFPHDPVSNDDMEAVLGKVGDKTSRARSVVLRSNGIKQRYYAVDRKTGELSMSNAQLTANAIRALDDFSTDDTRINVLVTGTSSPDQLLPNHGVMVHGELGWPIDEVVSTAGVCLAGATALKYAYLSVKSGEAKRAVATGSERASAQMLARLFKPESAHRVEQLEVHPEIAFEKDFLRWMLSDGAGALLLEDKPRGELSLKIRWIELFSYAHLLPACMYAGADKNPDGSLSGWGDFSPQAGIEKSIFAVKQDVRLLNENVVQMTVGKPIATIMEKHGLTPADVDWFLPHISSMYFAKPVAQQLKDAGFEIDQDKWFTNLTSCGNTGSASPYIMLDELFHSGRIQKGQTLLLYIPESGRFSSGFIYLEAV